MPEEGLKVHRFAGVLPEQLLTEASRHRDAVLPADQRAVTRCLGDDLAGFVHDVSHVPPPIQRAGLLTFLLAGHWFKRCIRTTIRWANASSCMRTFPTKAVHHQRDLVRGMVNGDAVYLCQRAAGPEE
jgi:hypothetical protein